MLLIKPKTNHAEVPPEVNVVDAGDVEVALPAATKVSKRPFLLIVKGRTVNQGKALILS